MSIHVIRVDYFVCGLRLMFCCNLRILLSGSVMRAAVLLEGAHNPGPTWPPAIRDSVISVTTWVVRCHGNTIVADDSCAGA